MVLSEGPPGHDGQQTSPGMADPYDLVTEKTHAFFMSTLNFAIIYLLGHVHYRVHEMRCVNFRVTFGQRFVTAGDIYVVSVVTGTSQAVFM